MRQEDIIEHLDEKPFAGFRIYMSDGATFDVRHPDLCMVTRSAVYVGIPDPKLPRAALRVAHCALIHVTRIEPLNGERRSSKRRPNRRR